MLECRDAVDAVMLDAVMTGCILLGCWGAGVGFCFTRRQQIWDAECTYAVMLGCWMLGCSDFSMLDAGDVGIQV